MSDGRRVPGKPSEIVSRTTARLARHPIALGCVVAAVGAFLAYIAWISVNGPPFQNRYELNAIVAADSPVLKAGDQVREAGKLAGTITDVAPEGGNLRVSMELRPEFAPVGEDARARVRVRSIVYLTYIEIDPGDRDKPMPEGGTIELANTGSGVDLLEVVQLFDEKTREELRRSLVNTGQGLAGRGHDLNAAIIDLDRSLDRGVPELRALTAQPGALATTIAGGAATTRGLLGEQPDDVASLVSSGAASVGAVANQRAALGASLELLPPFEDELVQTSPLLDPVLADARGLAVKLTPAAAKLNRGLPAINRLLSRGAPLRRETKKITRLFAPVQDLTGPSLYNLYPAAVAIDPILASMKTTVDALVPYSNDITQAALGVVGATSTPYPTGQTAPNNPALRFIPVVGCHRARDPYPKPGQALEDSASC